MGERPSEGHCPQRLDQTTDYSPENCVSATKREIVVCMQAEKKFLHVDPRLDAMAFRAG
jgi:hypothetical protein